MLSRTILSDIINSENAARELLPEIKKLIEFYGMQTGDRQISRVILSGGSANIKNFVPLLAKELNFPVEKLNPFAKISGAEGVPEEYYPTLAIAVGLAMRRPGDVK